MAVNNTRASSALRLALDPVQCMLSSLALRRCTPSVNLGNNLLAPPRLNPGSAPETTKVTVNEPPKKFCIPGGFRDKQFCQNSQTWGWARGMGLGDWARGSGWNAVSNCLANKNKHGVRVALSGLVDLLIVESVIIFQPVFMKNVLGLDFLGTWGGKTCFSKQAFSYSYPCLQISCLNLLYTR